MIHESKIECQHRWPLIITNRGLKTWFCTLHQKSVNDEVCQACEDQEGKCLHPAIEIPEFPSRTPEEVAAVHSICKSCPLMNKDHTCQKMHPEIHPVDIVAQHPSNHCPENLW